MADRKNERLRLRLSDLRQGLPTLTPSKGAELAEAATVCLDHHGHKTRVELTVQEGMTGTAKVSYYLVRLRATLQMRKTHGDLQDATEDGACAIAILLVQKADRDDHRAVAERNGD